ncbi:hypothetical protein ACHMW5_26505 [Azospirillum melinis]|uniref:hypothetical protein n=1 Tax=Azospirillum melinis TaxID=328839 RepID=UPI0037578C71
MIPQGCITVNPGVYRDANGPIRTSANIPAIILVDTGIPQSYVTLLPTIQFDTVEQTDPNEPTKTVKVPAPGTCVAVNISNAADPIAVDAFLVATAAPNEPAQVIPSSTEPPPRSQEGALHQHRPPLPAAAPVPLRRQARLCRHEGPAAPCDERQP